jgi:hypothetical protein
VSRASPHALKQRVQANQLKRNNSRKLAASPQKFDQRAQAAFLVTAPGKDRFAVVLILSVLVTNNQKQANNNTDLSKIVGCPDGDVGFIGGQTVPAMQFL